MANIIKYLSRRNSNAHAFCPSKRAGDSISQQKKALRRALKKAQEPTVLVGGTYWT